MHLYNLLHYDPHVTADECQFVALAETGLQNLQLELDCPISYTICSAVCSCNLTTLHHSTILHLLLEITKHLITKSLACVQNLMLWSLGFHMYTQKK
jgi:hypothetical protein